MIRRAARGAHSSAAHSLDDFFVGHVYIYRQIYDDPGFFEIFGLRRVSGEPVEDKPVLAVGHSEPFF
jgi:hypothetical protein